MTKNSFLGLKVSVSFNSLFSCVDSFQVSTNWGASGLSVIRVESTSSKVVSFEYSAVSSCVVSFNSLIYFGAFQVFLALLHKS